MEAEHVVRRTWLGTAMQAIRKKRMMPKVGFIREPSMSLFFDGTVGVSSGMAELTGEACTASAIEHKVPGVPRMRGVYTQCEKLIPRACDRRSVESTKCEPSEPPRMVEPAGAGGTGMTAIALTFIARDNVRASSRNEVLWLSVRKGAENRLSHLTSDLAEIFKSWSPPRKANGHTNIEDRAAYIRDVVDESGRRLEVVVHEELDKDGVLVLYITRQDELLPGNPPLRVGEVSVEEAEKVQRTLAELDENMSSPNVADDPETGPSQLWVAEVDFIGGGGLSDNDPFLHLWTCYEKRAGYEEEIVNSLQLALKVGEDLVGYGHLFLANDGQRYVANIPHFLSMCIRDSWRLEEAETLLRQALPIGKEKLRDGDPLSLALSLCFLGVCVGRTRWLEGTMKLTQGAFARSNGVVGTNMIEKCSPLDDDPGIKVAGFMDQPSNCILRKAISGYVLADAQEIGLHQLDKRPRLEEVMFGNTALSLSCFLEAGIGQGDGYELARQILIRQVFDGLVYIHSKDICHQDMSLENVSTARMGDVGVIVDENGITLLDHLTGGCPRVLSAWIASPWLTTALSKGILRYRGRRYSDPSRHSVGTGSEALKLLNMLQLLNYMHLKFFGPYSHSMSSSLLQPSIGPVFNKHRDFYGMRGKASKGNGDATPSTQNQELLKASPETPSLQDWRLYLLGVCVEMWYTVAWCSNHVRLLALHHNTLLGSSGEVHHRGTAARASRGMSAPWSSSMLGIMTAAGSVSGVTATGHLGAGLDPAVSAFLRWLCQAHWSVHGLIYALAGVTLYKGIVFFIDEIRAGNAEFSATLQELRQAKQAVIARRKGRSRNSS